MRMSCRRILLPAMLQGLCYFPRSRSLRRSARDETDHDSPQPTMGYSMVPPQQPQFQPFTQWQGHAHPQIQTPTIQYTHPNSFDPYGYARAQTLYTNGLPPFDPTKYDKNGYKAALDAVEEGARLKTLCAGLAVPMFVPEEHEIYYPHVWIGASVSSTRDARSAANSWRSRTI